MLRLIISQNSYYPRWPNRQPERIAIDVKKNNIKADMNSDILLHTAAIFFLTNFYVKQGIG